MDLTDDAQRAERRDQAARTDRGGRPEGGPAVTAFDRATAERALAVVEAALGDTLTPAARAEALTGLAAVLPEPADRAAVRDALRRADEAEARAAAMERAMESTAADALVHRGCHRELMAQCQRAERAWADRDWWRDRAYAVQARAERADRAAVYREAADVAERLMDERYGPDCSYGVGGRDVARELHRLADETAATQTQPEQQRPVSLATTCMACDHTRHWHDTTRGICLLTTRPGEQCDCPAFTTEEQADAGEPAVLPSVRPHTLTALASHLDARAVAILRPDSEAYREWQAVVSWLRRLADEAQQQPTACPQCGDTGACNGGPCPLTSPAAPEPEPPVHGESVAHLAGLHDGEPAAGERQDGAQQ